MFLGSIALFLCFNQLGKKAVPSSELGKSPNFSWYKNMEGFLKSKEQVFSSLDTGIQDMRVMKTQCRWYVKSEMQNIRLIRISNELLFKQFSCFYSLFRREESLSHTLSQRDLVSSSFAKEFSGISTHSSKVPTSSLSTVLLSGNWPFKMRYLRHHEILSHQRKK